MVFDERVRASRVVMFESKGGGDHLQLPIHKAQLLSYMKLLNIPIGLLINFHEMKVTDGVSRLVLPGAGL
jgi:GxxExxY protein